MTAWSLTRGYSFGRPNSSEGLNKFQVQITTPGACFLERGFIVSVTSIWELLVLLEIPANPAKASLYKRGSGRPVALEAATAPLHARD